MLSRSLAWAVIAVLAGGGCGGGGCNGGTAPDRCSDPEVGAATSLELGRVVDGGFVALDDGAVVPQVFGPQGGAMIAIALRLRGDVPACLAQETSAFALGASDAFEYDTVPRNTYAESDGSRTTREMFLILSYDTAPGDGVRVETSAAGMSVERTLYIEFMGPDGGAPDGGPVDAGADAASPDGSPGDAAAMLDAA